MNDNLARRIVQSCIDVGFTIFGSYVREHVCEHIFDPEISDIDVFSEKSGLSHFIEVMKEIECDIERRHVEHVSYERILPGKRETDLLVHHLYVVSQDGGRVMVDFVRGPPQSQPPFGLLDFECNMFVWDKDGVRLSRQTGTEIDKLVPYFLKLKENTIIKDAKEKVTTYIIPERLEPFTKEFAPNSFGEVRRLRVEKLLAAGWTIKNINDCDKV